jgi:TPR repeat protein
VRLVGGVADVRVDRPRAIAMLEKAARAGESSAAFRLGMLYDDGIGVAQDRLRAMAYFRAAAAGGAVEAMHNIGAAYASARGVRRDYAEALAWLTLAKKSGSQSPAEQALRTQIQRQPRPAELLATAERRTTEIERELAQKKVTDLLPPVAGSAPSLAPPLTTSPKAPMLAPVAPPASLPAPPPMMAPAVELPKVTPPVGP